LTMALACACSRTQISGSFPQNAEQNVLLVTVDTLRADALGCDGGPARTPNIDALARSGVRFTFAHAHAVVTLPSHASILTGTYPFQHGIRDNSGYRLAQGAETIATRLKAAGFSTAAFVGAFPLDARFGLTAGFDTYDGRFDTVATGGQFVIPERPASVVVARASSWIAQQQGRWFAWVHVYEPHAPYRPPPPFDAEYASQPYYGEVAAVDRALGPLFATARSSTRPTLVVLTGDHGEALGDHGEATHGLFAYESTLRVPLIVATIGAGGAGGSGGPGGAGGSGGAGGAGGAGGVSDAAVRHVDIVPTILDVVGLPPAANLPGHSLRTDADRRSAGERPSYFEAMSGMLDYGAAPLDGVLSDREKYIDLPLAELYDLARDAGERNNLVEQSAERRRALDARLAAFAAPPPGAPGREDAEAASRLRSLGYISGSAAPKARYTEADDPKKLVDVDRDMHEAVVLGESGRFKESVDIYRRVLARRPGELAAARHLAFDLWRSGDPAGAIAALEAVEKNGRADTGLRVQLGAYLVDAGRAAEAIALLREAAAPGTDLDALNALGLAYARTDREDEALAEFKKALALDANSAETLEHIGAVQLDAHRYAEARDAFERAARANPDAAAAHNGIAMVAVRTGDRQTAINEWKRAVQLDPTMFDALYDLGVQLARDGRSGEARSYLEQFARTAPPTEYAKELVNVATLLGR
jgi:arylsulfatase A-like enzyme/Flp pilus assembly protein TadD